MSMTIFTMKLTSKHAISIKNLFGVIVTFAIGSILISFQSATVTESSRGDVIALNQNEILRRLETGNDVRGFGRSLNEHQDVVSKEIERNTKQLLAAKLKQIEQRLRNHAASLAVVLVGSHDDGETLTGVTLKGHKLYAINTKDNVNWMQEDVMVQRNWSFIFCSDPNECPSHDTDVSQKVDVIPAITPFVDNPVKLCQLSRTIHGSKANKPCCQPEIQREAVEEQDTPGVVQPVTGRGAFLKNYTGCNSGDRDSVHWRLPKLPIWFDAGPLLRLQVLVTSLVPPRLYVSSNVQSGKLEALQDGRFFKQASLGDTLQQVSETYGLGTSAQWLASVHKVLLQYLVNIAAAGDSLYNSCRRCFQLLHVDLICHSITQCSVIKMSSKRRVSPEYLDSVWPIISSTPQVNGDVSRSLEAILPYVPFELCGDDADSLKCVTDDDLMYLLDDRKESRNMGDWIKIYPTPYGQSPDPTNLMTSGGVWHVRGPYRTHRLATELQKHYGQVDGQSREFIDRDFPSSYLKYDDGIESTQNFDEFSRISDLCSTEPEDLGKVSSLETRPNLTLVETTAGEFYANVSYDTILLTMSATAKHCSNVVKLENKYNSPGPKNITLGLGETRIRIYVIDDSVSETSVVDVIDVVIHRQNREASPTMATKFVTLTTCALKQDCSLKFDPEDDCGLHDLNMNWSTYKSLPWQRCSSGDSTGRWIVPCTSCDDVSTCHWTHSRWQPIVCSYRRLATPSLKQCLKGKKLLFVGDSTNRGILNYIVGRINGSLWGWDKTHTIKMYAGVNDNYTALSFGYYPHFWLPADHRPKFQKVIYQIIKSLLPLENNSNTVLVVGGVQWLARQHIDYIIEALQKKGLSNIRTVVKGLGAGFHQPVGGLRFVPGADHALLAKREADTLAYARTRGLKVAATFNMTMARYKDFLEGKCACHFHKVTKLDDQSPDSTRKYTVIGEINAVYSDIVIDQICS